MQIFNRILLLLILVCIICCLFRPFVLSIDSAYGFLAYKGSLFFHRFNVLQEVQETDMGWVRPVFMSWWSPGQWLFPGMLNYFFGMRLGLAAIAVTAISVGSGFAGYYRLFLFFNFSRSLSALSLLVIFASSTFYYCFIVYQGGEVLEFAIFPWFVLYVFRIRTLTGANLLGVAVFFFVCFLAKTTLLIYGLLILAAKIASMNKDSRRRGLRFRLRNNLLILPGLVIALLVYTFYLSKGPRPALFLQFGFSWQAFLVPATAVLGSLLSIQQWIERIGRNFGGPFSPAAFGLYIILLFLSIGLFALIRKSNNIAVSYKILCNALLIGLAVFFIPVYCWNGNIDFSSRHFKLMGYLFVPSLLTVAAGKWKERYLQGVIALFCLIGLADILYLKGKWTANRYITESFFYQNCEPPPHHEKLDLESYRYLVTLDNRFAEKKDMIFFIESTADAAIGLHHACILQTPDVDIQSSVYYRAGPSLIAGISKETLLQHPNVLKIKFPDYQHFDIAGETSRYIFFISKPATP